MLPCRCRAGRVMRLTSADVDSKSRVTLSLSIMSGGCPVCDLHRHGTDAVGGHAPGGRRAATPRRSGPAGRRHFPEASCSGHGLVAVAGTTTGIPGRRRQSSPGARRRWCSLLHSTTQCSTRSWRGPSALTLVNPFWAQRRMRAAPEGPIPQLRLVDGPQCATASRRVLSPGRPGTALPAPSNQSSGSKEPTLGTPATVSLQVPACWFTVLPVFVRDLGAGVLDH